jgi:AcrR family transcriptional regulator
MTTNTTKPPVKHRSPYSNALRRKNEVLDAAVRLSMQVGYQQITRDAIAVEAGCGYGTVNVCYRSMSDLRRAVVERAIATENLIVIAQYLADPDPDPAVGKIPPKLKKATLAFLAG